MNPIDSQMNLCYNQINLKRRRCDTVKLDELLPLIRAANGLSLNQVCSLCGLEASTVQNWIKRGFVPHPVSKKYFERHVARILTISALRDAMQIESIGELMRYVNGDADDESDDIISETELYGLFAERAESGKETRVRLKDEDAENRLNKALRVMTYAYKAALYKADAEKLFEKLKEE